MVGKARDSKGSSTAPPHSLAAREDISPRGRQLLDALRGLCGSHLEAPVRATLDDVDEQFFRLADQSHNNAEQTQCLASQREVRRHRADILPRFLLALDRHFAQTGLTDHAQATPIAETLSLVDNQDMELGVAINDMAGRAELRAGLPLYELGHRIAVLTAHPVFDTEDLPFGPRALLDAWTEAGESLDLPLSHQLLLHRLFERHVMNGSLHLYEALNGYLLEQRILPNLRASLNRRMSATTDRPRPGAANEADAPGQPRPAPSATAGAPGEETPGDLALFNVLHDLLARRRQTLGLDAGIDHTRQASSQQLQQALSELQRQPAPPTMVDGQPVARSIQQLRQAIMEQLRRVGKGKEAPGLADRDADTFDLIDMLFEHLGREMPAGGRGRGVLTRMQVPLLRVALSDPGFFSRHDHPARRLLESLTEASVHWLDGAGDAADRKLAEKVQLTVDRATNEFDGDLGLLDELRSDLDTLVETLTRRAEIAERRHVEAAQGRERLELARKRASELIAERMRESQPGGLLRTMMEQAWTDVMALTILRWGERSEPFRRRMQVTDRLLRRGGQDETVTESDDDALREEITSGLGQVGIQDAEAAQIARSVVAAPASAGGKDETAPETAADTPSRTELAMQLKRRQRLGNTEAEKEDEEAAKAPPLSLEEQKAYDQLRQMPFGTWLECRQPDGNMIRRKLAWYSPITGHCLMVNQRGARCAERNMNQLAREMASGMVRLPGARRESLLDRAWNSIVNSLRQFADPAAETSV